MLVSLLLCATLFADPTPLWQIGTHDKNTADLALGPGDYRKFTADGIFIVGVSDAKKDWPYVQPGPIDEWAKSRPHENSVLFGLTGVTDESRFKFTADFVDTQSVRPPRITLLANGKAVGNWQAPPGGDDMSIEGDPAKGKPSTWSLDIPPKFLRNGTNELVIRIDAGCWVLYDDVRLESLSPGVSVAPAAPSVRVSPVPQEPALYRGKDGLEQRVQATVLNLGPAAEADLMLDGRRVGRTKLTTGPQTVSVTIPHVESKTVRQLDVIVSDTCRGGAFIDVLPVRKWEVFLLPHSHVDIGYTNIQTIVEQVHRENILESIKLAKASAEYPKESRYRWNVETIWAIDAYLGKAKPEDRQAVIDAIKRGDINLDASYVHALSGMTRPEELLRNFRLSRALEAETGVPIDSMMLVDVPGAAWGIVPAMAHAGVKYFLMAPNSLDRIGGARVNWEDKPFYWVSPSGKERVLVWQVVHYSIAYALKGFFYDSHLTKSDIPPPLKTDKPTEHFVDNYLWDRLRKLDEQKFPYDMLVMTWGLRDNAPIDADLPEAVKAWNEKYAFPHITISSTHDAFVEFEKKYARQIPEVRGDYSPYWEEGAASTAREAAMNRASSERLVQAETLFAMLKPSAYNTPKFLDAWRFVLLFSEHTWGAHSSVWRPDEPFAKMQWEIKRGFAEQADARSHQLIADALATRGVATESAIDVFNTCSWPRTDLVTLAKHASTAGDRVEAADGKPVPSQRLRSGELVFIARDVPALGGARFTIKPGEAHVESRVGLSNTTLTSDAYDVRIDESTGTIASIKSKTLNRELVDASAQRAMNEYVYLLGSDAATAKSSGATNISVPDAGPLVATLRMVSSAPGANQLTREVRLVAGLDRVDLLNIVDKKAVREKEGVHFAFPNFVVGGQMRLDTPWAVVRPEIDQLAGANRNFLSVQRWLDISNDAYGVTWSPVDAALIEIGGLSGNLIGSQTDPDRWIKRLNPSQTFYSWVMNNHWHTNYKADQSGPVALRYSLRAHEAYKPEAAARFGIERSQPLIVAPAAGPPPALPVVTFVSTGVLVTALKPADDGKALIVRLFGASGKDETVQPTWRDPPKAVYYTNLTEKPGEKVEGAVTVPAWGIVSLRAE